MLLILHILVALTSVAAATYAFVGPSKTKLNASYTLVALTITSGTYLVFSAGTSLRHACASGLAYLAAVTVVLISARRKLIHAVNS